MLRRSAMACEAEMNILKLLIDALTEAGFTVVK